ncbi:hypothetical protein ACIBEK_23805 [Nocardia fusca]|uniref:hypothetical protein n=1 Tax=Nocardia fusca TaxID=941183 RepID=UPI0037AA8F92
MTPVDQDSTVTTITGAATGVIVALRRAAVIAAEHGHNYLGVEDLLTALLETTPPMEVHRKQRELGALTFDEVRHLARSVVPGPVTGEHGPAEPATVTFEVSGRHAEEFIAMIERNS